MYCHVAQHFQLQIYKIPQSFSLDFKLSSLFAHHKIVIFGKSDF
jgi:hypothetical protein